MAAPTSVSPYLFYGEAGSIATVTGSSGAETLNQPSGVVTTESLSTAQDTVMSRTLTNSFITASSHVLVQVVGGTNTTPVMINSFPAAGSATIKLLAPGAALNGTIVYFFQVC